MLVVDTEKSERGPQRRKSAGRLLHCCCVCGKLDVWQRGWSCFCSVRGIDDGDLFPKFCSAKCQNAGGDNATGVTPEMLLKAKQGEIREPEVAYRPATENEKYRASLDGQKRNK